MVFEVRIQPTSRFHMLTQSEVKKPVGPLWRFFVGGPLYLTGLIHRAPRLRKVRSYLSRFAF